MNMQGTRVSVAWHAAHLELPCLLAQRACRHRLKALVVVELQLHTGPVSMSKNVRNNAAFKVQFLDTSATKHASNRHVPARAAGGGGDAWLLA